MMPLFAHLDYNHEHLPLPVSLTLSLHPIVLSLHSPSQANTFQCVLATNGTHSFATFLYADGLMQWTRSQIDLQTLADHSTVEVGFNAHSKHFTLPTSHTDYVLNITTASNVKRPGEWVFRVDDSNGVTFPGKCRANSLCRPNLVANLFLHIIYIVKFTSVEVHLRL